MPGEHKPAHEGFHILNGFTTSPACGKQANFGDDTEETCAAKEKLHRLEQSDFAGRWHGLQILFAHGSTMRSTDNQDDRGENNNSGDDGAP